MDVKLAYRIKYLIEEIGELEDDIRKGEEAKNKKTSKEHQLRQLMVQYVKEDKGVEIIA